jgi:hypothetical protein
MYQRERLSVQPHSHAILHGCFLLALFSPLLTHLVMGIPAAVSASPVSNIVVRGILICLDQHNLETNCKEISRNIAIKDKGGTIYALKDRDTVRTLLTEKRLNAQEFQLTLSKPGNSPFYELVKSQFIRDGKLYDFYYFCEVCNITTFSPGLCACCRQETEYREKLAE